ALGADVTLVDFGVAEIEHGLGARRVGEREVPHGELNRQALRHRPALRDIHGACVNARRRGLGDIDVDPDALVLARQNVEGRDELQGYGDVGVILAGAGTVRPRAGTYALARPGAAHVERDVAFVIVLVGVLAQAVDLKVADIEELDIATGPVEY